MNQDPTTAGEQGEGTSAAPGDVRICITRTSLLPSLTSGSRSPPIPIILIVRTRLLWEGSARFQKQLWRSRKRRRRRERSMVTMMTTITTTMEMSTPPYRSRSGQTSQANPSRPSGALKNAPNARNSSRWCALRPLCRSHLTYEFLRPSTRWLLTLRPAIFATLVPRHLEQTHLRSLLSHASASPLGKGGISQITRRRNSLPSCHFVSR